MSDLIDRQEVFNAIKKIGLNVMSYPNFQKLWHSIEVLPSAEPEWTPVTECLPAEEEDVLVTVRFDGIKPDTYYVDIAYQIDGEWSSYKDKYKVLRHRHHVIAWAPLPKPWGGER